MSSRTDPEEGALHTGRALLFAIVTMASFSEGALRVQQPIGHAGFALGVRAGTVRDDLAGGDGVVLPALPLPNEPQPPRERSTNRYVNPYFTYDLPGGSVGGGYVWHEREFPTAGEVARESTHRPLVAWRR